MNMSGSYPGGLKKKGKKAFQEEVRTYAKACAIWGLHHDLDGMKPAWLHGRNSREKAAFTYALASAPRTGLR